MTLIYIQRYDIVFNVFNNNYSATTSFSDHSLLGRIFLRAERSGTGDGRVYTITYEAVDASGNTSEAAATVTGSHPSGVFGFRFDTDEKVS